MIYHAKFFVFVILVFGMLAQVSAAPGDLDPSFDGDGIAITDYNGSAYDDLADLIIQPDGKIVVVGSSFDGTGVAIVLRYNPDGSLDSTFGTGGKFVFPIVAIPTCVALQADGKIVVGGRKLTGFIAEFPVGDFFVGRVNTNGTIDTTFNGTGTRVFPMGGGDDVAKSVKIQSDGKIVLGGTSMRTFSQLDYALARLNTDGSLDTTVLTVLGDVRDTMFGELAIQPDGKIVATGNASYFPESGIVGQAATTVRYNPDLSLDTSFDGDGIVTTQEPNSMSYSGSLVILADGKILIAGSSYSAAAQTYSVYLVKYNTNGSLDTSFGTNGRAVTINGWANDVVIQPDNKIAVSMGAGAGRFTPNGFPDGFFSGDGYAAVSPPNYTSTGVNAIALQSNGKIVVGGTTATNSNARDFLVARFENACTVNCGTRFADFDGDGRTDVSIFRPSNGQWWIKRSQTDSTIVYQFGASTDRIVPGDYTGDGKADVAIWRPSTGEWFILRSEDSSFYSFPFGMSGDLPVPANYDGDGKTDVAIFRPSHQTWFILNSSGGMTVTGFGISGDLPVPADYDGDNKADIAIYRPSNGQWWLNRSTAGVVVWAFGVSTDRPVQGDYTGDGKADVAFWRPSTAEWFILRSENASYYSYPYGVPGDIPSPGDYDGDGKFDAATFRSSNTQWWMNWSTSGTVVTSFGASGDTPVPSAFVP